MMSLEKILINVWFNVTNEIFGNITAAISYRMNQSMATLGVDHLLDHSLCIHYDSSVIL